jgi:AcrR family transcriptional regulator
MTTRGAPTRPDRPAGSPALLQVEPGRRGEILDAALSVFVEKGYEGGTMRDIAQRVGVTEPAIYRHFASKEELFLELLRSAAGRMRHEVFAMIDALDPADVRGSIIRMMADRREAFGVYGPALRTVILAAAHNPAFMDAYRNEIAIPLREKVTEATLRVDRRVGMERSPAELTARVRAVMSVAVGTLVTTMVLGDEPDTATADAVVRIMGWESV